MISRKSARLLAEFVHRIGFGARCNFYDFLYDRDYDPWFCNVFKQPYLLPHNAEKDLVMRLHTGEAFATTTDADAVNARQIGQKYIQRLSADLLTWYDESKPLEVSGPSAETDSRWYDEAAEALRSSLELDGYQLQSGTLRLSEASVLDEHEQEGVLETMARECGCADVQILRHHLDQSAAHYADGHWDDSISNSRKALEWTLRQVATAHHSSCHGTVLGEAISKRPAKVREYLESIQLISSDERTALQAVYGMISGTGGHPHIGARDEARLARHLALILSEFVMRQLEAHLRTTSP